MKQCMDSENLHRRLKKIIGQVQAIDRMIDKDVPCEDVLAQINAAKSALHGCGKVVLEGHIKHCVRDGIEHGDADKTIENFTKAVERFSIISRSALRLRARNTARLDSERAALCGSILFALLTTNTPMGIIYTYPIWYQERG